MPYTLRNCTDSAQHGHLRSCRMRGIGGYVPHHQVSAIEALGYWSRRDDLHVEQPRMEQAYMFESREYATCVLDTYKGKQRS